MMEAIETLLQRYTSPFRDFGFAAGLLYGIDRALSRLLPSLRLYCYELMVQPVPDTELTPSRHTRHIALREIRRGDTEVALMPAREDIKETRFSENAICLGAFRKEEFIGYIWFRFQSYEEDEVRCTYDLSPADEAVFDFDLYIFPAYRMGTAFVGIWNEANKFLRSRGIRYSFSRLTRFNLASRRAHHHLGCRKVAAAVFLQAAKLQLMAATVFPYVHLSLRRSTRVHLRLRPDALSGEKSAAGRAAKQ